MSKKFKSIKKGLHEAIANAEGGMPDTRIHLPDHGSLLSLPNYFDGNCTQMYLRRAKMRKNKISIEDFKNDEALSLHSRESKEVARSLDAKAESLPYSKARTIKEFKDFFTTLTPKRSKLS
jgi:hypothetical protein